MYLDDDAGDVFFCFFLLFLPGTATIIILIAMHFLYFAAKKKPLWVPPSFDATYSSPLGRSWKDSLLNDLKHFCLFVVVFLPHPTFVIYPTWQFEDVEVENNESKRASAKSGSAE